MVKDNAYYELPKTATVFNLEDWDRQLTNDDLKDQAIISASYDSEINAYGDLGRGYGPMPRWWCINCQGERSHQAVYCHGACGHDCRHRCESCGLETLANISEPNMNDNNRDAVRQAVAQAQRKALATKQTSGIIEIDMSVGNTASNYYQCQILMYDTSTKDYRVAYRS